MRIILCCLLISSLFLYGCKKQEEMNVDELLAKYKQDNKQDIIKCYNDYPNNTESFCNCLGGYAILNFPRTKIFCGNTKIELPYVEVNKILS